MKKAVILLLIMCAVLAGCGGDSDGGTTVQGMPADLTTGNEEQGEALFTEAIGGQAACSSCHTTDESRRVGPGMAGIATRAETTVEGQNAREYLYASIVDPGAHLADGYANLMPSSFGRALNEQQLLDLVAYLMTFD